MNTYFIKSGYRVNRKPVQYLDTVEDALIYQVAVYRYAADLIEKHGFSSVLDVGCGLGLKLGKFIVPTGATITGVDTSDTIALCTRNNAFGRWFADDLESPYADLRARFDQIICADVIEHLADPDTLMSYFRRWSHPKTQFLISTPERDLRRGANDMGPPGNGAHVREWNQKEFQLYLEAHGLTIIDHLIVELKPGMLTCQLACCAWTS